MRKVVKTVAALLIVFSAAFVQASVDSASVTTYCKVINVEDQKQYRLIYQSAMHSDVEIKLLDNKNKVIYTEQVTGVTGFVKNYDLSNLADGQYSFSIIADDYSYSEELTLGEGQLVRLRVVPQEDGRVALIGKNEGNESLTLRITDAEGNNLYSEEIECQATMAKLYSFKNVSSKEVSFLIYENQKVVKVADVKL